MTKRNINDEYFEWLFDLDCRDRYSKDVSYKKLLMLLHNTKFKYFIPNDKNRADEGLYLRYRFTQVNNYDEEIADYIDGPCSVLEMMIALAIHCEENIMDNPDVGDRTTQWFWGMINSLGLGSMMDDRFDRKYSEMVIQRFLDREYEPNGKGGLFTIPNCKDDLRDVEIWYQLNWYLDSIFGY